MSAPASTHAHARSIAASSPSTASASVRAMMTKFGSVFASAAALMRSTISSLLTISLFGRWPQRFCCTWSSMCIAAAPNLVSDFTVRAMLKAPPQPVSTSTSSGRPHTSVMRRMSVSTSSSVLMPRSGSAERARGDTAAGEIDRAKPDALGEPRGVGVDRAGDLQRFFLRERLRESARRAKRRARRMIDRSCQLLRNALTTDAAGLSALRMREAGRGAR